MSMFLNNIDTFCSKQMPNVLRLSGDQVFNQAYLLILTFAHLLLSWFSLVGIVSDVCMQMLRCIAGNDIRHFTLVFAS